MHLQQQARAQGIPLKVGRHVVHGDLHDVGRRALNGCIERLPLGIVTQHAIRTRKVGKRAASTEDRLGVAVGAGLLDDAAQVVAHRTEAGEIVGHELLRLCRVDTQLLAQAESAEPVGEPVTHGLHLRAHLARHVSRRDAEDARTDEAVKVFSRVEGLDETFVAREMRHDAHLDLRVVGREQAFIALAGYEGRADAAAHLSAHRNVLQVRVS